MEEYIDSDKIIRGMENQCNDDFSPKNDKEIKWNVSKDETDVGSDARFLLHNYYESDCGVHVKTKLTN